MEKLDIYNENKEFIGSEDRNIVHKEGLWHKTVHCWLYDKEGNVFFQIRSDKEGFYTTASGHIIAGETISEAFDREIKEEIGIDINEDKIIFVDEVEWKMDKIKKDGTVFHDRAWANVYICEYEGTYNDFNFDNDEVDGLVRVNSKDALDLFENKVDSIQALIITSLGNEEKPVQRDQFLLNKGETLIGKYGKILESIINC